MAGDELFKRYLEIGSSVLSMSRERAEGIVRDLVASGEVAKSQAAKATDWLVERGRAGTEELTEMVRREIRQQVAALGLATKDDLARLEARIDAASGSGGPPASGAGPGSGAPTGAGGSGAAGAGAGTPASVSDIPPAADIPPGVATGTPPGVATDTPPGRATESPPGGRATGDGGGGATGAAGPEQV